MKIWDSVYIFFVNVLWDVVSAHHTISDAQRLNFSTYGKETLLALLTACTELPLHFKDSSSPVLLCLLSEETDAVKCHPKP